MLSHTSSLLWPHRTSQRSSSLPCVAGTCASNTAFTEPLRSPGYAHKTLTSRPAFEPRWRLPALAYRQLIPVATYMRVSPTTTISLFEAKLAYFRLGSKSFLPTLKPRLAASAPRLDTGSRYSLPGREFHPTILCTPNRRTILLIMFNPGNV